MLVMGVTMAAVVKCRGGGGCCLRNGVGFRPALTEVLLIAAARVRVAVLGGRAHPAFREPERLGLGPCSRHFTICWEMPIGRLPFPYV